MPLNRQTTAFYKRLLAALFLLFLKASSAQPASTDSLWIRVSSPNFEIYSDDNKARVLDALRFFEQVHEFFSKTGFSSMPQTPVTVIAFRSAAEYTPYRLRPAASAQYQRIRDRDYIVVPGLGPECRGVVVHEYTHFLLSHLNFRLPLWLNEGLAEVYSSLTPVDGGVLMGHPLSGRVRVLKEWSAIDIEALFQVDQHSPYYSDPDRTQVFYAESWAFTHMLAVSPAYYPKFNDFVRLLAGGAPPTEAFNRIYRKNISQVARDFEAHLADLETGRATSLVFPIRLDTVYAKPQIAPVPDLQLRLTLANLLAFNTSTEADGAAELSALEKRYTNDPRPDELLGYLAFQQDRAEEALGYFQAAIIRHSQDARIYYYCARLKANAGAPDSTVIALLKQALVLDPDYADARFDLGILAAKTGQFDLAIATLSALDAGPAPRAYSYYYALAYCRAQLNEIAQAKRLAELAKQNARTQANETEVSYLIQYLSARTGD